jgi:OmcA/MtrC family decaheme c-type cytochrome
MPKFSARSLGVNLRWSSYGVFAVVLAMVAAAPPAATAQGVALAWDQVENFQYKILSVSHDSGARRTTVVFSVTDPQTGNSYNILGGVNADEPFRPPATLQVYFSWNAGDGGATELVNTKSGPFVTPRAMSADGFVTGPAPASATSVNALTSAGSCSALGSPCALLPTAYWVGLTLPTTAADYGRIGIGGHPSIQAGYDPVKHAPIFASIPVTSVYEDYPIRSTSPTSPPATARRKVVDFSKCKVCHDNGRHGDTLVVPRLSLHGANRNEEPQVCVMCHNPNQTDAAYRTSGAEESVDFKRLIHGIHAGGFREKPLVIIGRNGSVNDFSHVRFPARLSNCLNCHIDVNRQGTFELPLASKLGSTIVTGSVLNVVGASYGQIDSNPADDLKISPIAATCSACHDKAEVRRHMIQKGASFGVVQSSLENKEQCFTCHGPGTIRDVRRQHEISSSSR